MEASVDTTQGIKLNWTFPEGSTAILQEILGADVKWFSQSRVGSKFGWRWLALDAKVNFQKFISKIKHL